MSVAGIHDRGLQQAVVTIYTHQGLHGEHHKAQVVLGGLACSMEQDACIGRERPVVVLTRTIDAIKRFLVEQHLKAVLVGHALHEAHEQHVMVDSQIGLLEDRGTLKLVGGHLVVAGLYGDAQLQGLYLQVFHESHHTLRDGTEIVVVHLLVLGALVAHQRATSKDEVGTGGIQILVDEEILLLPTNHTDRKSVV